MDAAEAGVLELVDVEAGYGGAPAPVLKGLSLSVAKGEFVAIIGPNGCGKTTTLKVATGLLPARRGDVRLLGRDVKALGPRRIASLVGVVPQQFDSPYDFTVRELARMGRYAARAKVGLGLGPGARAPAPPRQEAWLDAGPGSLPGIPDPVEAALEATGMGALADRVFASLSGGEKQRAVLAQALAGAPSLLFLDEPTAHLDIGYQLEVFDLLRSLHAKSGVTVLAVLHDLNLAAQYAGRVVLLTAGSVFAEGSPAEVLTPGNLREAYGVDARVFADPMTGRPYVSVLSRHGLGSPPGGSPSPAAEPSRRFRRVHVVGGGGAAGYLLQELYQQGYDVSAGVLNRLDTDWEVAVRLGCRVVEAPPFSPIGPAEKQANSAAVAAADAVVVANIPLGKGNLANLETALEAVQAGKPVIALSLTPVHERDFTGGAGAARWEELVASGASQAASLAEFWRLVNGTWT